MDELRQLKYPLTETNIPEDTIVVIGSSDFVGYTAYLYLADTTLPCPDAKILLQSGESSLTVLFKEITHWDHVSDEEYDELSEVYEQWQNYA